MVSKQEPQVRNFDSYAPFFALGPEKQAEVARRVREDAERNAAKQAEAEAKRVAEELERLKIAKATEELMVATAAKWKEHRRPQEGERVEYQVLRIGQECGQQWPTDEEVREILRKDPLASGPVYGTHYAIRFTHKQMVPTPVLLAETPGDAAQAEQREHNPFASPSMVTSSATLPKQGQAACDGEGVPLGQPAAGSRQPT